MSQTAAMSNDGGGGTIPERVFAALREAIVEGRIAPGSKISEPELARAYGISRGPLREAIGRLDACGLVVRRANVGARVIAMSRSGLLEIFYIREALEGMAARLAAQQMTGEEIADLRRLLAQHDEQISRDASHAHFQRDGDLDFHYRIVQGSHNQRMIELLCNDLYHVMRLYRYQFGMPSKRGPTAFQEHRHIVDAIERRDAEMAELLMRSHIRASRENLEVLFEQQAIKEKTRL